MKSRGGFFPWKIEEEKSRLDEFCVSEFANTAMKELLTGTSNIGLSAIAHASAQCSSEKRKQMTILKSEPTIGKVFSQVTIWKTASD
ncbi:hypothetical protein MUP01_06185 [Candidatus Bathyarchaeota archaeon]|nr:hypothetical protein [Candidatus Bathyarchaeota archaeon]